MRLTPAGEHLASCAGDIERDIERAMLTTRWIGGGEPSRIRVAVGFYDTAGWLLDTFTPEAGSPRIELLRFSDADLLDAVRNRAADIAIARGRSARPACSTRPSRPTSSSPRSRPPASSPTATPCAPAELYEMTFLTSDYRAARGFEFHEFFLAADLVPTTVCRSSRSR